MKRLRYVDFLRGSAVVWMIVAQSIHSLTPVNMYENPMLLWVNWFPLFMIVVGYSLALSFKRPEGFFKRNGLRVLMLIAVGWLLCLFQGWTVFDEALSGIGLSILFLLPLTFYIPKKYWLIWFLLGFLSFITSQLTFWVGAFNPFWLLSFMTVGVGFCRLLEP